MHAPNYAAEGAIDEDEDLYGDADIVEWYEARPMTVSTAVATGSVVAAFALGVLTAIGAIAVINHFDD